MPAKKIKILAIDPGTREMGYAHLENKNLIDFGVKYLRHSKKLQDMFVYLAEVVNRLISEKRTELLVIEKCSFSHSTQNAALMIAVSRIKGIAKKHGIPIYEYAHRTISKAVCDNGNATKQDISKILAVAYPELKYYLGSDKRCKEEYFQNIFDAVACGITHYNLKYEICPK